MQILKQITLTRLIRIDLFSVWSMFSGIYFNFQPSTYSKKNGVYLTSCKPIFILVTLEKALSLILTHSFDCPSKVIKENNLIINLVTSIFFRKSFSIHIVTALSQNRSACKTVQSVSALFKRLAYI